MDWNDFNRELQNRVSDSGTRYILGIVYERLLDTVKQVDQNNQILLALAETINNVVVLNDVLDGRMRDLRTMIAGQEKGVSLESVPLTNDDDDD